jgi:colanic acid biosynthesis glycosyl transferase WcaI
MRILILSQFYPPEPTILMQELAQTLMESGHDVTVLTGFPNYPSGNLYSGYRLRLYQREKLAGVPVVRAPLYPDHSRSAVRRVLNYFSFAISSTLLGAWLTKRPDVIFVHHPPITISIPTLFLSWLWRVPFVYQIQDMWPETLKATGMLNSHYILNWIGRIAKFVYARAAKIVVISPGFRKNLIQKGVPADKVHFISNWTEHEDGSVSEPDSELATKLGLHNRFNIMFAGNMGEAQGLMTVIEAAALLEDIPEIQFVLVGDGTALTSLKQAVQDKMLSNVRFLGRYPQQKMPALYALADILLVHLKNDPLFEITIPHKILTYLGAGKPILAAVSGDAATLVVEANAGIRCQPENAEALSAAVRSLFAMPHQERHKMGERALHAARTTFSRSELAGKIELVLKEAVFSGNRRHNVQNEW